MFLLPTLLSFCLTASYAYVAPRDSPFGTGASNALDPRKTIIYNHGLPVYQDVQQGSVNDCWLAGAAAAFAWANPTHLQSMLFDLGNGEAQVNLWDWTTMTRNEYKVTKPVLAQTGDSNTDAPVSKGGGGIWPEILQTAFQMFAKDHPNLPILNDLSNGAGEWAFWAISGTGPKMDYVHTDGSTDDSVFETLLAQAPTRPAVSTSKDNGNNQKFSNNIVTDHTYTVMGYDPATKLVSLRNPWAYPEKGGAGIISGADGCFSISFEDWKTYFIDLTVIDPC